MTVLAFPEKPVYTVADLQKASGLGRDSVRAAIRCGQLPGYLVGSRYVIPHDAFWSFCTGTWVPTIRPIFTQPITPIVTIRKRNSA